MPPESVIFSMKYPYKSECTSFKESIMVSIGPFYGRPISIGWNNISGIVILSLSSATLASRNPTFNSSTAYPTLLISKSGST